MLQKTWFRLALTLLLFIGGALTAVVVSAHKARPAGAAGAEADAMARAVMEAADVAAWRRTGAVRWDYAGRQRHLWDRRRHLAQVFWSDIEVIVDLNSLKGRAWREGQEVTGAEAEALIDKAHGHWINDAFWLNPLDKLMDPSASRGVVVGEDGQKRLLVSYSGGGRTPGDAYLWRVGQEGLPDQWQMWVSILPVGGVEATWERWQTLSTGARVSTLHQTPILNLELTDVAGAADLATLLAGAEDPFCRLPGVCADAP